MKLINAIVLGLSVMGPVWATDSVVLEDFSYSFTGNTVITGSGNLAAYWGTYSGGTFTLIDGSNAGFAGLSGDDMTVTLSQTSNGNVAASTQLAVGFFDMSDGSLYSSATSATARAILTDTSWLAPVFSIAPGGLTFSFTASTVAQVGSFTFGGAGSDTIGLVSAVPEPATWAGLLGAASLGFCALRRRRSV